MTGKAEAIKALDEAPDGEIVYYAEAFAKRPSMKLLSVLAKLVAVDGYADKYLAGMEEEETAPAAGMMVGTVPGVR